MPITVLTMDASGVITNSQAASNGSVLRVKPKQRFRLLDSRSSLPPNLTITQIGDDALVQWQDPALPNMKSSLILRDFNTSEGAGIFTPNLNSSFVDGFSYSNGLVSPTNPSAMAAVEPASFTNATANAAAPAAANEGSSMAAWWWGGTGLAILAGAFSGGSSGGSGSGGGVIDTTAPRVAALQVQNAPADHNYAIGETIQVKAIFDEAVTITGGATLALTIGSATKTATYNAATGFFEYTVQAGDFDSNGFGIAVGGLSLASGATIKDAAGNNAILTHTGLSESLNHTVGKEVHTIVGTAGNDDSVGALWGMFNISSQNPSALGLGLNASVSGGNRLWRGDDLVQGLGGDDAVIVYAVDAGGNDTLDGGSDTQSGDILVYEGFSSGITIDLSGPTQTANLGAFGNQTLIGFERFALGQGNDVFTAGASGVAVLDFGGNDTMTGGIGNDFIGDFDTVADVINGGAGTDWLVFNADIHRRYNGISITLSDTATTTDSDGNQISNIENVAASEGRDTVNGSAVGNEISTYGDDDEIDGGAGEDTIYAGIGRDTVYDNDLGADSLHGDDGFDTADFSGIDTTAAALGGLGLVIDLNNLCTELRSAPGLRVDSIHGFEAVIGTQADDSIIGNQEANLLQGGAGNDVITIWENSNPTNRDTAFGGDGEDTIMLGKNDIGALLYGDAGSDWVDYKNFGSGNSISVNLSSQNSATYGVDSNNNSLYEIEHVSGTHESDTITGSDISNILFGNNGDDVLHGGLDGSDTLFGGNGNDTILASIKADSINGGAGIDWLDYSRLVPLSGTVLNISVNLAANSDTIFYSDGTTQSDTISNIEVVVGSNGTDTLIGDSNANVFYGGNGADVLIGGDFNDTLYGGEGNDTIYGGSATVTGAANGYGYDTIYGEDGNDAVNIFASPSAPFISGGSSLYAGGLIDLGAGHDTVEFQESMPQTATYTVIGGDGDDVVKFSQVGTVPTGGVTTPPPNTYDINLGEGDDTLQFINFAADVGTSDSITVDFGNGDDLLSFEFAQGEFVTGNEVIRSLHGLEAVYFSSTDGSVILTENLLRAWATDAAGNQAQGIILINNDQNSTSIGIDINHPSGSPFAPVNGTMVTIGSQNYHVGGGASWTDPNLGYFSIGAGELPGTSNFYVFTGGVFGGFYYF